MPDLAVELHTSLLGHAAGDTAISHLRLLPGENPVTSTELEPGGALPVGEAQGFCLYRDMAVLRAQIAQHTGAAVTIEVAEQALRAGRHRLSAETANGRRHV